MSNSNGRIYEISDAEAQEMIKRAMGAGWLLWIKTSAWGNRKKLAQELIKEKFGNDAGKINTTMKLLDAEVVGRVTSPMNRAQGKARDVALPWFHSGVYYILERDMEYLETLLKECREESNVALQELIERYESLKAGMEFEDTRLYNAANYPTSWELERKFNFEWGWQKITMPVAEGVELSVVSQQVVREENAKFRERMKVTAEEAVTAARQSFMEIISHLRDSLKDPEKVFQESTVEKPKEFLKRLPLINIYGDVPFAKLAKDIEEILDGVYAEDLRGDQEYRQAIGSVLDDVVNVFQELPMVKIERALDL